MDSKHLEIGWDVLSNSANMINLSMYTGTFPSQFKTARAMPVLKNKRSPLDYGNYRPISCISDVAKIMERVLHRQLQEYLFEHAFITGDQSAYRSRVMLDLLDGANDGLYSGNYVLFRSSQIF